MSIINVRDRTINSKIVYYGTALGGKTTSLKHVHRVVDPAQNVELVSLNTENDRTLFFDFLPISLGKIGGFTVSIQGFTVPGQVRYNLTRKYVLTGADAVVMVIDSRRSQLENNIEAFNNLKENLAANGLDYDSIPIVIQYNKQDLDDLVPVEEMDRILNDRGLKTFETVATEGPGVFEAFVEISRQMIEYVASRYSLGGRGRKVSIGDALEESLNRRLAGWSGISNLPGVNPAGGLVKVGGDADQGEELAGGSEELLRQAVGTNIEIARLYSDVNEMKNRLRARVSELTELNDVGRSLTSLLDVNELLPTVLDSATRCLGTEHGSLLLLSRDGSRLTEEAVLGFLWDPLSQSLPPEVAPKKLLDSARRGNGLLIDEERNAHLLTAMKSKDERIRSAIVAPLLKQKEVFGLIAVYFLDEDQEELGDRLRFLSALASHASVALENARLVTRIEGFNRELEQTVRDRTAELRKAYEELKELDRLKDDFLSSMSHELLTPLTSICSFSEILLSNDPARDDETLPEFLGIIHREAGRLTDRLKTLLDLSQLEGGHVTLERAELDASDLLARTIEEYMPQAKAKDIELKLTVPEQAAPIEGDPAWLSRAVSQVVANAIKFSDEGGRVAAAVEVNNGMIDLVITDEGPGIALEYQERIFERFKQIGEILTTKPTGIGLGLPLARRILTDHGGKISVVSEPGKGSRFVLSIPSAGALQT